MFPRILVEFAKCADCYFSGGRLAFQKLQSTVNTYLTKIFTSYFARGCAIPKLLRNLRYLAPLQNREESLQPGLRKLL